jgi:hypothetical protein
LNIIPYNRKYTDTIRLLYQKGVIESYPKQIVRDDLQYAEGVDIVINLKSMTPAKFKEYAEPLLWAAYEEAKRYVGEPIIFAKFSVRLSRNEKGRKVISQPVREYTARSHPDPEILVFGKQALGYVPTHFVGGKEVELKASLSDKVDEVLALTDTYMKDYLQKQRPYKVLSLTISVRRK